MIDLFKKRAFTSYTISERFIKCSPREYNILIIPGYHTIVTI